MKPLTWILMLIALSAATHAQDADGDALNDEQPEAAAEADEPAADPNAPKTLSGMSILGNEEAPKSLVIIPWKSSEIGSDLGMDDSLNERAEPVDREVFLRELEFYEIRSGE